VADTASHRTLTPEQARAFFALVCGGDHHLPRSGVRHDPGSGRFSIRAIGSIATFDSDELTRLVLLAHFYAIRVEVEASGPGGIRIFIHGRQPAGRFYERHPSIAEAQESLRHLQADPLLCARLEALTDAPIAEGGRA